MTYGFDFLSVGMGTTLEVVVVPIRQGSFRHAQKRSGIGHVAGANQLGGAFEKAFGRMRAFGQERNRGSEALATAGALELMHAHVEIDAIVADGQVLDVSTSSGLMNGF